MINPDDKLKVIAIDGNEANQKNKVGVHRYAFELLWGMYRLHEEWKEKYKIVIFLKETPKNNLPKEKNGWNYHVLPGKGLWILKNLMPHLWMNKNIDVFFSPSHYLPPLTSIPKVCTIHDLGYLKFSAHFKKYDFWQLKYWSAISIIISKYIIAVSKSVKKNIVRQYKISPKKVQVIHHGLEKDKFNTKISSKVVRRIMRQYKIDSEYLLFLSSLKPSKNIEGIIDAYDYLIKKKRIENTKLVIAGKKAWMYDAVFEKVRELGLEDKVIFTGYVDEKDKPALLTGAKMLLSPSFWEGFGMHVIEAMACGTPVVVSDVASLPEVISDAGVYVDPESYKSIAEGIVKINEMDEKQYNRLKEKCIERSKVFDWDKTARETLKLLAKAI